MKVLLVEDDQELANTLTEYLGHMEFTCEHVNNIADAIGKINLYDYDILIVDLMLGDGSGLEVISELKRKETKTGIIIISAKKAVDDKVTGLETGADDYLPKPFHFSELNARIFSIFRRLNFEGKNEFRLNELTIDPAKYTVSVNEQLLDLTRKEYELLLYLLANKNRVLSKESIATHIWGDNYDLVDSFDFVYNHVKNLRRKIREKGGNDYIRTMYGIGYKFELN